MRASARETALYESVSCHSMLRRTGLFVFTLLLIEFLDEFVFGAREAAWPLIRDDLGLTYTQIGVLLGAPGFISNVIEPFLAVLGDVWRRRVIVLAGGAIFCLALLLSAVSQSFLLLLVSFILMYPASGAYVSLSQATLMDLQPARRENNMARWTFAGSIGVVAGPLVLGALALAGIGWRGTMAAMAVFMGLSLLLSARMPYPDAATRGRFHPQVVAAGLLDALRELRRGEVLRWLALLELGDLMLDVLLGFLALYMVDVAGVTPSQAGLAVAVWTGVGLVGDFVLIPLLERVRGLSYLRISAALELVLFPVFLLVPGWWPKLIALGCLGFFNSGWYAVLQAQLYATLPGRSGAALAVKNISGLVGSLLPLALGLVGQQFGLSVTMWLLLAGPIALLIGLPRGKA